MSAEVNKAAMRSAMKEFNEGNLEGYVAHYDESLVTRGYPPELPANLGGLKAFYAMMFSAFTDANVVFEDVLAEGDEVEARFTFRAEHTGEFMGIPPTNEDIVMGGITILRFRDGKIVERWQSADLMGLMGQPGAIPEAAEA